MKLLKKIISLAAVFIGHPGISQVVINEVMVKPSGNQGMISGGKEYVEIYNNSCQPVDIGCFIIANRTAGGIYDNNGGFKFPPGTIISPYQHLVVGTQYSSVDSNNIDFSTNSYPGFICNTGNWLLGNYDAWVALYNDSGTPVDAIYWTSNANEASKINTGTDYDDNPCLPPGCTGTFTLLSAKQIFNTYPAIISYAGQAPSTNLTYSRIPDGGAWQREISPSISNIAPSGNCNGGTCNPGSAFTVTISFTNATCGANNGSATATPNPGGTYTYLWSANANNQTTQIATGLAAGTYLVTLTGSTGCTIVDTAVVDNTGGPTVSVSTTPATCGNNNGTAVANVSGVNTPYSYSWNTIPSQTDSVATGLAPGSYSVTVTDNSNCTVISTGTVSGSPSVTVSVTPATCSDNNGTAVADVFGGTAPFTYLWSTIPSQTDSAATGLAPGNYSVTVTDINNCTATAFSIVTGGPNLSIAANPSTCGNSDGNATANPAGGATPYTYLWSNSLSTQTITGLSAGNYSVTVTDDNGCSVTGNANIGNMGGPVVASSVTPEYCSSGNGSATVSVTGGSSPFFYSWNSSPAQFDSLATGLSAGTYSFTVTDDNNCMTTGTATITGISGPDMPVTTQTNPSCGQPDGGIVVSVTGGTSPFQYSNDGGTNFQSDSLFNNLSAGIYDIIVRDANNCFSAATAVTLATTGGITVTATSIPASCNEANNGSATATPAGGNSPYAYLWSNNQTLQTATGLAMNNYSVTITDSAGCSGAASVIVGAAGGGPVASIAQNDTAIFYGTSIQLSASGGITYQWSTGETAQNITVTPLASTSYIVTVTDAAGCTDMDSINIIIDDSQHAMAISTVFTPNSDGINDVIKVHGYGIKEFRLLIYDRWGERIKEITRMEDSWDGTFRGKPLNSAVFVYMLETTFINGETYNEQGNITLIK